MSLKPLELETNQRYTINATATFVIPTEDGGSVETIDVERNFDLVLADQDYWQYIDEYQAYERAQNVTQVPFIFFAILLGVGGLGYGGYLVRDGAFSERTTGGLSLVIKRMSGSEKLGIEAHSLDKASMSVIQF